MKYLTASDIYNIPDTNIRFRTLVKNIEMIKRQQVLEEYTPQHENPLENGDRSHTIDNTSFI